MEPQTRKIFNLGPKVYITMGFCNYETIKPWIMKLGNHGFIEQRIDGIIEL